MPNLARPAVQLKDIRKNFGNLEVLHGVSLTANEGEVISILGSSGSGKSTLLRCVNMLEVPNAGSVAIMGEEIALEHRAGRPARPKDIKQVNRLRERAAMVFQSFNLWSHLTILRILWKRPCMFRAVTGNHAAMRLRHCLSALALAPSAMPTHPSCPAASSNVQQLPVPWRCDRMSCCLMSPRRL
nr:hypothetical protein K4M19_00003 [Agrobacterium fabrum]